MLPERPLSEHESQLEVTTNCFACRRTLVVPLAIFNTRTSVYCAQVGLDSCWYDTEGLIT